MSRPSRVWPPGRRAPPAPAGFIDYGGFQCGICTPGQIIAATALLDENPTPTEDEIKDVDDGQPLPLHRLLPDHRLRIKAVLDAGQAMRDFYFHTPATACPRP